jgi:PAS domain S-box-containing protein
MSRFDDLARTAGEAGAYKGEAQLADAPRELQLAIDTIPALVEAFQPDGTRSLVNRAWRNYTALQETTGEGRPCFHPDDIERAETGWRASLAAGEPFRMDLRLRGGDGNYRWHIVRRVPLRGEDGEIVKWYGTAFDIEDQKAAEMAAKEALRGRGLDFRLIVDSIPAPVAVMTPTGEVEAVNRPVLEYFGKTFDDLKGWASSDAVHPDDLAHVATAWMGAVETGHPYEVETRHRRADGVYRWFHVRGFPLRETDGRIARWCVLQTDIDDRKRAEALLAGENRLLEMVARGSSLPAVLDALCGFVENLARGCHCCILLIDSESMTFRLGAGPGLPPGYNEILHGRPLDSDEGPCGMAASLKEQVIVPDVALDPRWVASGWRSLTLAHGLRSYWSTPILSGEQNVLGTFVICQREPGSPTPLHQGLIRHFTHIASIAIERGQGEAALKRSEVRKAAMLDSALDCIVTIDHEGRITEFNPAAERTFGYRRDQVAGKSLADVIIPPSLREKHRRGLARYLATGETGVLGRRIEVPAMRADGSEFPIELAITRIPLDGAPSFTGYLRDITERKQAEEKLRRSEAFLAEGQYLSRIGSFSWRVATDEITWSEQLYRIFEFDPGLPVTFELIGARTHPEDLPAFQELVERSRRDGSNMEFEFRLQMPDRSVKYLHVVAHGTRGNDGGLEYIGAAQDVTQRRLSEEALGQARSELAHVARVTSLGVLTASIAHEVNQPLAAIITNGETSLRWLARPEPDVQKVRDLTKRLVADARRASEIIDRIRAMATRRAPERTRLSLDDVIAETMIFLRHEFQSKSISVSLDLEPALPQVDGDRTQLQQVVVNLAINAVQAIAQSGAERRRIFVRTILSDPGTVCCSIEDSGPGIDPTHLSRLFESFFTTKDTGMGMGLPICRSIIEGHGGSIRADNNSALGGARFSFSLPANGVFADEPGITSRGSLL